MIPEFSELITPPILINLDICQNNLLKIQARGDDKRCANNFPFYNIPGLRRAHKVKQGMLNITSTRNYFNYTPQPPRPKTNNPKTGILLCPFACEI